MLTTRIRPNDSVNPLASRNSKAASDTPLTACRIALLVIRSAAPTASRRAPAPKGSALVRSALEELLGRIRPELRHLLVGLDGHVDQHVAEHRVLDLLDLRDVDVLDRVVVLVEAQRPARRVDLRRADR